MVRSDTFTLRPIKALRCLCPSGGTTPQRRTAGLAQVLSSLEVRAFPSTLSQNVHSTTASGSLALGHDSRPIRGPTCTTTAVQCIRRMRGVAQSLLLRCSDGAYYVVKFQNNLQGIRVLANDLLGTLLARQLGLPVSQPAIVLVSEALIRYTDDMYIELKSSHVPCLSGSCFGSRYPSHVGPAGRPVLDVTYDFIPSAEMYALENLADFAGMLVFDKWTGNTDGRQAIFNRHDCHQHYHATMIDQGYCFNGAKWNFPDAPLRGLLHGCLYGFAAYANYRGFDVFEPWLGRLENEMSETILVEAANEIPKEWYERDECALTRLLETLDHRRKCVRDLLWALLKASPESFPQWSERRVPPQARAAAAK